MTRRTPYRRVGVRCAEPGKFSRPARWISGRSRSARTCWFTRRHS
jgi:hypothetical protein